MRPPIRSVRTSCEGSILSSSPDLTNGRLVLSTAERLPVLSFNG